MSILHQVSKNNAMKFFSTVVISLLTWRWLCSDRSAAVLNFVINSKEILTLTSWILMIVVLPSKPFTSIWNGCFGAIDLSKSKTRELKCFWNENRLKEKSAKNVWIKYRIRSRKPFNDKFVWIFQGAVIQTLLLLKINLIRSRENSLTNYMRDCHERVLLGN